MAQIPGGLTLLRSQEISDTSIVGTKNIALAQPVADLAKTIYYPQWITGGGYLGASPFLGHNLSFELTARDNLRVIGSGDASGLYPFVLKIEEYAEDLKARVVSGTVTYSTSVTNTDLAISPALKRTDRAFVRRLSDYQQTYNCPAWARFWLPSTSVLRVAAYQSLGAGGVATTYPAMKFLVGERP